MKPGHALKMPVVTDVTVGIMQVQPRAIVLSVTYAATPRRLEQNILDSAVYAIPLTLADEMLHSLQAHVKKAGGRGV